MMFVKHFSEIAKLMTNLLVKEATFDFSELYLKAFNLLKEQLINTPVVVAPDWTLPFQL